MGRPWEYPRWRRALMQAVMWLIFGCALGLAQLVTYHRSHTPIELGNPLRLGAVLVRMPDGWMMDRDGQSLEAKDPETGRILSVALTRTPSSSLGSSENGSGQEIPTTPLDFRGLHLSGRMAMIGIAQQTDQGVIREEVLFAETALPGGVRLAIELGPVGTQLGPADERLLREVANAITLAPPRKPAAPVGKSTAPARPPVVVPRIPDQTD